MYPSHPGPVVVDLDAAKLAAVTAQGLCQRTIQLKPGCVENALLIAYGSRSDVLTWVL